MAPSRGGALSTIHFNQTTTLSPEQFAAGLTDFGPGRSKVVSKSADDCLTVHHLGTADADVREGSGVVWERLHYDWSEPDRVVLTTTDSNTWGGRSGYVYTFTQLSNGLTDVHVVIVRQGKNTKGSWRSCLGRSARASSPRRSATASRRSRPATAECRPLTAVLTTTTTELAHRGRSPA